MSYREKIEGNELDLSLNELTEVPVKELASATKAICVDLSCNCLQSLPNDFATLTHLVKIDLSRNRFSELPANFGNLLNLQHLDLYGNNIVSLPISFCRLKNLRWLDLKNNPLEPKLKNIAGDCIDEKECQACAKKVVTYMQSIESDLEREKQKKLKVAKEKELHEKAKQDKELEEQRRLKKIEKEKRKAESKAKREAKLQEDESQNHKKTLDKETSQNDGKQTKASDANGSSCFKFFIYSILFTCLVLLLSLSYGFYTSKISTTDVKFAVKDMKFYLEKKLFEVLKLIVYYIPKIKEMSLKIIYQYMQTLTYFASRIEQYVALYF